MDDLGPTSAEPGTATLVAGIVEDAQELLKQQVTLFKAEVRQDAATAKAAALFLALGAAVSFLGAILLGLTLVYLLQRWFPNWHLWVCYSVAGVLFAGSGGVLVWLTLKWFKTTHVLPEQSVEAMKENVEWKTNAP
jgi:hypothetical protein